ncbi:helix-turn-helix domain-containing protein [Paenibacillus hodogayensis]|uniref:Helix-turn-helix domain-containing protein n=1 Tax=Paenibacillus hodogayensis TaxID=279208 RepID=A0ABV5VP85_9BACL
MNVLQTRLTKKLFLILLALLLVAVSLTAFLSYRIVTGRLQHEMANANMELLRQIDEKLKLVLKDIDRNMIRLLKKEEVRKFFDIEMGEGERKANQAAIDNLLNDMIQRSDALFSVDLYSYVKQQKRSATTNTDETAAENYEWIGQFYSADGFQSWLPTRKLILDNKNFPLYQDVVTSVRTYPLLHSPGYRRGAAAVSIKQEALYNLVQDAERYPGPELSFVIDRTGQVILHPDFKKVGQHVGEIPYIAKLLKNGKEGSFVTDVDTARSSVFYFTSEYTGWKLIRIVPVMALNKPLVHTRNTLLAVSVLLFAAAALAAVLVSRWTFKPINRFIFSMSRKLRFHPLHGNEGRYSDEFDHLETMMQDVLIDSERLEKQIKESKPLMRWRLLMKMLTNDSGGFRNMNSYLDLVGVRLYDGCFVVMSIQFDNRHEIASARDLHLYAYALCNIAEEIVNAEHKGAAMEWEEGRCAVIVSFEDKDNEERLAVRAVAVADQIKHGVHKSLKKTVTIGVGGIVYAMPDISLSYKQSMEALKYRLIIGGNMVITADEILDSRNGEYNGLFAMMDSTIDSLKQSDAAKLQSQVAHWFESLARSNVPPDTLNHLVVQLLMRAAVIADEIGMKPEESDAGPTMEEVLSRCERLEQIREFTDATLSEYIRRIAARRNNRDKNEKIEEMVQFIQHNYKLSDLSLHYLSDKFQISLSHLSRMFKEYTGDNFIDYLTELRVAKAKELLTGSGGKIRDVAERVGYTHDTSFIRIFKKFTGLTPSEYREREGGKPNSPALAQKK